MKKLLSHILATCMGAITFVLFAIPQLTTFIKANGKYQLKEYQEKINGYELMKLWDTEFAGVMTSLFQVLVLVCAIALLVYGVMGILKETGVLKSEAICKFVCSKISALGILAYAVLNVLVIFFVLIYCGQTKVEFGETVTGVKATIGLFLPLVLAGLSFAGLILVNKGKEEHHCNCGCEE